MLFPCLRSEGFDVLPILTYAHKSGNAVICGGIHELVDNIAFGDSVMRKSCLLIIDHYSDGALILDLLGNGKAGKLGCIAICRHLKGLGLVSVGNGSGLTLSVIHGNDGLCVKSAAV